ncbi:YpoC family protein [Alkalihalobacillus sp. 1P02AB]|uniref:YpoC family protein n=1 Tax=Alkalihalobacillus sp. 1P02AB TaxID=3132260 RepID=UPI0039A4E88E
MKLPSSFQMAPFYENQTEIDEKNLRSEEDKWLSVYFYFDLTEEVKPWLDYERFLAEIFHYWNKNVNQLKAYFHNRKPQKAKPLMMAMSALLIDALFWLNKEKVRKLTSIITDIEGLVYTPVNSGERIHFILTHLSHYQGFVQMEMLFEELKKLYARVKIIERK